MKKLISTGLAAVLTVSMLTAAASAANSTSVQFDFSQSDSGFVPIFADYPNTEGVEEFYEFRHSWGEVPIPGAGKGLFISGNNHSDDLFMGYVKMLDGFVPARTYRFTVSFKLATDVEGGLVGVGGSPGESVAVKCGITPTRPTTVPVDNGAFSYHRMNIDTGRQGNGGKDRNSGRNLTRLLTSEARSISSSPPIPGLRRRPPTIWMTLPFPGQIPSSRPSPGAKRLRCFLIPQIGPVPTPGAVPSRM